ncbi:MAG: hypothetical protein ABJC09_03270 [Terriglobia bacterium]
MSTSAADRLMVVLNLSLTELIWEVSGLNGGGIQAIPLLQNKIGPGNRALLTQFNGCAPFSISLTKNLIDPVAARIAPDLELPRSVAPHDLALIDQNPTFREHPWGAACWVVLEGGDLRIRCLKLDGTRLLRASEASTGETWHPIPLHDHGILDVVKGRVVWIGREISSGGSCG